MIPKAPSCTQRRARSGGTANTHSHSRHRIRVNLLKMLGRRSIRTRNPTRRHIPPCRVNQFPSQVFVSSEGRSTHIPENTSPLWSTPSPSRRAHLPPTQTAYTARQTLGLISREDRDREMPTARWTRGARSECACLPFLRQDGLLRYGTGEHRAGRCCSACERWTTVPPVRANRAVMLIVVSPARAAFPSQPDRQLPKVARRRMNIGHRPLMPSTKRVPNTLNKIDRRTDPIPAPPLPATYDELKS